MVPRRLIMKSQSFAVIALAGLLAAPARPAPAQSVASTDGRSSARPAAGGPPAAPPGGVPVAPPADAPAEPFGVPAAAAELTRHLVPARPTVFIFTRGSSTLERRFLQQV